MKHLNTFRICLLLILLAGSTQLCAQVPENWTTRQLMEPSALAKQLQIKENVPVIISVGPGGIIPQTIPVGVMNDSSNIKKLRTNLKDLVKNKEIVLYCGCCPFEHCPNIRPAIDILKKMGFTNWYLLNLPHNLKRDWIDKGYPVTKLNSEK